MRLHVYIKYNSPYSFFLPLTDIILCRDVLIDIRERTKVTCEFHQQGYAQLDHHVFRDDLQVQKVLPETIAYH